MPSARSDVEVVAGKLYPVQARLRCQRTPCPAGALGPGIHRGSTLGNSVRNCRSTD
jgi:hypothetical protein